VFDVIFKRSGKRGSSRDGERQRQRE
jgi:hypothetical protein